MIIIYDDHTWWSYMMIIIYDDHHTWWSYRMIIYDSHIRTYNSRIWLSYIITIMHIYESHIRTYHSRIWLSYMSNLKHIYDPICRHVYDSYADTHIWLSSIIIWLADIWSYDWFCARIWLTRIWFNARIWCSYMCIHAYGCSLSVFDFEHTLRTLIFCVVLQNWPWWKFTVLVVTRRDLGDRRRNLDH